MKCSYSQCLDLIKNPQVCKACKLATYCSTNCRVQDFYKGHQKICKSPAGKDQKDRSFNSKSSAKVSDFYEMTDRLLGAGSYGEVKLAKKKNSKELSAIKIVNKKQLIKEKIPLESILREITLLESLSHKNIIKLKESFVDDKKIYLVLEFAEGGNLYQKIELEGRLAESQAKVIHRQVVEAVKYLHEQKVVHRDLKPENVLLDARGVVKICDLGWSVQGEAPRSTFCGTIDYMAPEMVKGLQHSYEVDIWALGVLLYEMLHGKAPFEGSNPAEKCSNIVHCNFSCDESVSNEAKDLIAKMIQKNPEDRIKIEKIFSHPFFQEKSEGVKVGDTFRHYVPNYGIDDCVVQSVGILCEVLLKKNKKVLVLSREEVLKKVCKENEKKEKISEIKDVYKKTIEKCNKIREILPVVGTANMGVSRSFNGSPQSSLGISNESILSFGSGLKEKSYNNIEVRSVNLSKASGPLDQQSKGNASNESFQSNFTERLEKLAQEVSENRDSKAGSSTERSGLSYLKANLSQNEGAEIIEIPYEEQIYDEIGKWIKSPAKRRRKQPKNEINKLSRDKSLDKKIESFKGRFALSPEPSQPMSSFLFIPDCKLNEITQIDEEPEIQETSKYDNIADICAVAEEEQSKQAESLRNSYKFIISPSINNADLTDQNFLKYKKKEKKNKGSSLAKDQRFFEYPFIPSPFPSSTPRDSLKDTPGFPFSTSRESITKTPNFCISNENEMLDSRLKEFHKDEPEYRVSNDSEKSSLVFYRSNANEDSLFKSREKPLRKLLNFESERDKIEQDHEEFYNKVDNHWEDKKTIVRAVEISENKRPENPKRTFSEFDEILRGSPSFVNPTEGSEGYEKNNSKLKTQKRNLEELILNMDKIQKPSLRHIRKPKKKVGLFKWIGSLMGCNDRY